VVYRPVDTGRSPIGCTRQVSLTGERDALASRSLRIGTTIELGGYTGQLTLAARHLVYTGQLTRQLSLTGERDALASRSLRIKTAIESGGYTGQLTLAARRLGIPAS
jgi:hypothetical protein